MNLTFENLKNDFTETILGFVQEYLGEIDPIDGMSRDLSTRLAEYILTDLTCWFMDGLPTNEKQRVSNRGLFQVDEKENI